MTNSGDIVYEGGPANRVRQSPPLNVHTVFWGNKGEEFTYVDSGRMDAKGARVFVPESTPNGYTAGPKCGDCGELETIITRVPPLMVSGLNALCGIGEEWECSRCGHIWSKAE